MLLGRRAHRTERALLEDPQERDLGARRQRLGLVEEHRASGCVGDEALPPGVGVGERAPFVAEQLALEQRVDQRAAVHRDERASGARGPR